MKDTFILIGLIVLPWIFFFLGYWKAIQLSKGVFKIIIALSFPLTLIIAFLFRYSSIGIWVGNTFYFQLGIYIIFYLIYLVWLGYKKLREIFRK